MYFHHSCYLDSISQESDLPTTHSSPNGKRSSLPCLLKDQNIAARIHFLTPHGFPCFPQVAVPLDGIPWEWCGGPQRNVSASCKPRHIDLNLHEPSWTTSFASMYRVFLEISIFELYWSTIVTSRLGDHLGHNFRITLGINHIGWGGVGMSTFLELAHWHTLPFRFFGAGTRGLGV